MADWIEEWGGMILAPGGRYVLDYGRSGGLLGGGTLQPFAVADQGKLAQAVTEGSDVTLVDVSRAPFSDNIRVTVQIEAEATPREVVPASLQVQAELLGSVLYELERIKIESLQQTPAELARARRREEEVGEEASGSGTVGQAAGSIFAGVNTTVLLVGGLLVAVLALRVVD